MAIDKPITDPAVKERKRTWRVNVETPDKAPTHAISVFRETLRLDAAGNVVSRTLATFPVQRMLEAVKEETVEVGDTELTAEDVFEALNEFSDRWAEEDEETAL